MSSSALRFKRRIGRLAIPRCHADNGVTELLRPDGASGPLVVKQPENPSQAGHHGWGAAMQLVPGK